MYLVLVMMVMAIIEVMVVMRIRLMRDKDAVRG